MVDNKVKTKTAMLQELESIKNLLLEDDDIPILQEVIDDQLASRDQSHQPPLEPQDLNELQHQFQALSETFSPSRASGPTSTLQPTSTNAHQATNEPEPEPESTTPQAPLSHFSAVTAPAPSLFDTQPPLLEEEKDNEDPLPTSDPLAHHMALPDSHKPTAINSEPLIKSDESVHEALPEAVHESFVHKAIYDEPVHEPVYASVDKSVAPVDEPLAPVHEQVEPLQSVSSSAPIQQALPMDVVATDTHPHPQTPVRSSTQSSIQNPAQTTTVADGQIINPPPIAQTTFNESGIENPANKTSPTRPALAKASGENPFLPQHIRARLHGNNPPPLFDFMVNKTSDSAATMTSPGSESDKNTLRQNLIKEVVEAMLPKMEEELRQRLKELTQQELERLRDQS